MLDLNLLPLVRRAGQDQFTLPGLYAINPPRRAARGRSGDQVILYLSIAQNDSLSADQLNQLLSRVAQTYYETPGSVTAAARTAVEFLNQYLLDRNLRGTGGGKQATGVFIMAVAREERLYLAQCGPVHTLILGEAGVQEFYDPDSSSRGLGLARPAAIRYYQMEAVKGAYALLCPKLPPNWSISSLHGMHAQGLESLRRRLLGQVGADVTAVLVQITEGSGKMRLLWPKRGASESPPEAGKRSVEPQPAETTAARRAVQPPPEVPEPEPATETTPPPTAQPQPADEEPFQPLPAAPDEEEEAPAPPKVPPPAAAADAGAASTAPTAKDAPLTAAEAAVTPTEAAVTPARRLNDASPASLPKAAARQPRGDPLAPLKQAMGVTRQAVGRVLRAALGVLGGFFKLILPDESLFTLPSSTMIFLAVVTPVVISVVGAMVYIQRGLAYQGQSYVNKAVQFAEQAQKQTDPVLQRAAWEETLKLAATAQAYDRKNPQAKALYTQANTAFDQIDRIKRLQYQPAVIDNLGRAVKVTQMTATADELYLLNGAQGSVKRTVLTGQGYKLDAEFRCGPGPYGSRVVGPLLDMVDLPKGSEFNATILAMDGSANLLYCIPHDQPKAISLATPTIAGWGTPNVFALDRDTSNLYVLDAAKRKIWIYQRLKISEQPISFFDETVDQLPVMENVVDMAVNRTTLYLLHQDGQLTVCEFGRFEGVLTRCQSPVNYLDDRPGRQSGPQMSEALFQSVQYAPPPDPSLFLFDPAQQAVYQFGLLQINFYFQYRPLLLDNNQPATAFTVSDDRTVFLALGNQVYYARLTP